MMTYEQAQSVWDASDTVKRGVLVHQLSNSVRLHHVSKDEHNQDDAFIIRHRNCDIVTIFADGLIRLSQGSETRYRFVRRNLINKYVPPAKALRSFYNGMTIHIPKREVLHGN